MPRFSPVSPQSIDTVLRRHADATPAITLHALIDAGQDMLPLPGAGTTMDRWRILAAVGAHDLGTAKLFEGHTDALAILHEAGAGVPPPGAAWGTWCAEPPDARLLLERDGHGSYRLHGCKAWCSGAAGLSHALVSCWSESGAALLAAVDLRQDGVTVTDTGWHAVGMAATGSVDVLFDHVPAMPLGDAGFYVRRAGFWHGGAGVAACWHGAATTLANRLRDRMAERGDPHRLAQLGDVAVALGASAALMRETAAAIDRHPGADAMLAALSVRLSVESAATRTLDAVGRALGAGPFCKDARFARLAADLPVYLRQSHAERDLEAVGRLAATGEAPWTL